MSRKGRAAVLVCVLAAIAVTSVAVALAADSGFTPKLGAPNGRRVKPGRVHLTAKVADGRSVFVWVTRKRKLKHGQLAECTNVKKGCLVASMKKWKHHADGWTYTALHANFHGFWATTPGRYYWQVESFAKAPPCKFVTDGDCSFYSKIGSFTVR
jgi:hypothetical protein